MAKVIKRLIKPLVVFQRADGTTEQIRGRIVLIIGDGLAVDEERWDGTIRARFFAHVKLARQTTELEYATERE